MATARMKEPTSTISAVLTIEQIRWLTEEADRRNISRASVIREAVERGIAEAKRVIEAQEAKAA